MVSVLTLLVGMTIVPGLIIRLKINARLIAAAMASPDGLGRG